MALTDAELDQLKNEAAKIPVKLLELEGAVKRADEAAGRWGQGPEARVKALEEDLKNAKSARDEIEARYNARIDELETRLNRPGAGEAKGQDVEAKKAFADYVRRGIVGPGLQAAEGKTLATNDGANGGFLMPAPLVGALIQELVQVSPIRAHAAPNTISQGDALDYPAEDGSFEQGWVGETQSRPATANLKFKKLHVPVREQYAFPKATQKMLDDSSFNVEQYINQKLAQSFGKQENYAFLHGDDVQQPQGLLTHADVSQVKSGSAAAVTADGLLDLIAAMPTEYTRGASLFMNRKTTFALRKLKDSQNRYLWEPGLPTGSATPGSGLTQPLAPTFAGVPIVETPDMPDVAANSLAVVYTDWRQSYRIVDKATVGVLRDPYTDKPNVGFYSTRRVGGRVVLPAAAKIQKIAA